MDDKSKDIIERAAHAFWQGGLATVPVTISLEQGALESAALAFIAGGLSAVLSLIKGMVKGRQRTSKRE